MRANRILAIVLALVMVAGMCPLSAFAADGDVMELGVSHSIDVPWGSTVYTSVTVDAGGFYALYADTDYVDIQMVSSGGETCDFHYGKTDESGGRFRYFNLPEADTYQVRIENWYTDLTLTMLMKPCQQPTALHLMDTLSGTVGYFDQIQVTFGSPWEFAGCTWSSTGDGITIYPYDNECSVDFLQAGTAVVTAQTTAADGTLLTRTCAVTSYEKAALEPGKTVTRTVSPDRYLYFTFTPAATGYYCVPSVEYVFYSMRDTATDAEAPSSIDNGDALFFLEGGRNYDVTVYNGTAVPQTMSVCPQVPEVLTLGQETRLHFSGEQKLLAFTPEESGSYSLCIPDVMYLGVYDRNLAMMDLQTLWGEQTVTYTAYMEAGQSYLIRVGCVADDYTGTILLDRTSAPESISLEKVSGGTEVFVGREDAYFVHPDPAGAVDAYTWSIADESVAVITGANSQTCWVMGVSVGTTILTCRSEGGLTATMQVTVSELPVYTVTLDQPLTLEKENGQSFSVSYTVPEDGYYVFYCNSANLECDRVECLADRYVDDIRAFYLYVEAGCEIVNDFTECSDMPITRTFTLAKTRLPEQLSMAADDYYVFVGDARELTPHFDSVLDFDLVTGYSIENEDLIREAGFWSNRLGVEALRTGSTRVTMETESGLTAACMVHVIEPCGGGLTLGQPADVRYVEESFVTYTFTPDQSGDYIVRVEPDADKEIYLEVLSEDYEDLFAEVYIPGTAPALPVTLRGGVSYSIGTLAFENAYTEGTILVEKADEPPAAAQIATGWSGNTTWVLTDDGVITFSGSGPMKNYTYKSEMPWYSYFDQITDVVIEEGVTAIGSYAFYGMDIETIRIPGTVTAIGDYAFKNCVRLDGVQLPEGLTSLGDSAFYACTSLTGIEIPASLWTIKPYTFKNCTALEVVLFNEGNLQKISDGAFYNTALKQVTLPDCLDILDGYVFKNCADLASVMLGSGITQIRDASFYGTAISGITIPEGVTVIKPYAFKNCENLKSVDLPATLTVVDEAAFYACTALEQVVLPDAVTAIGNYAFRKCTAIETLAFGSELVTIGECAFYGCTGLTELVIPDQVTTIDLYAFKTCTGLTSVTLGSSVQTIGEGAFNTCTGLKTIVFPASLTSIGAYCFSGSWNLWKLTFRGDAPAIGGSAFKGMRATAFYPGDNATWTDAVRRNYGGSITWKAI